MGRNQVKPWIHPQHAYLCMLVDQCYGRWIPDAIYAFHTADCNSEKKHNCKSRSVPLWVQQLLSMLFKADSKLVNALIRNNIQNMFYYSK